MIIYQHAKNQYIPSVHSLDPANFRVPSPDWSVPFLTMLTLKILKLLLIRVKLYQHAKNHKTFKCTLSGLRQFLATESPLKLMKNAFHLISKALFVLKIFEFLFWLFGRAEKRLDWKDNVSFKFTTLQPG